MQKQLDLLQKHNNNHTNRIILSPYIHTITYETFY